MGKLPLSAGLTCRYRDQQKIGDIDRAVFVKILRTAGARPHAARSASKSAVSTVRRMSGKYPDHAKDWGLRDSGVTSYVDREVQSA